ncbi:MAG: RDD family protein [Erysipelotrichaceae bacterium]|nr:RDD family protein [Erysipelotrichaceae bacterium]
MHYLWKRYTKWIDRKPSKVGFSTRFIAYLLDWAIGGIITGLPAVFIYGGVTGRSDMFSDLYVFPSLGFGEYWSYIAGVLCIVTFIIYFIYIPYKVYPGQTLGKRIMKIKILRVDEKPLDIKTLIVRHIIGLALLESTATVVANYIRQMITLLLKFDFEYYLAIIGMLITIISTIMVYNTPSRRAIHDYLAHTRVASISESLKSDKRKK